MNPIEEFTNALGALAESLCSFHRHLTNVGFSEYEALELTKTFLRETFAQGNKNKEEN